MQMADLYIRGAIATQTMAKLSNAQVNRINNIVAVMEKDEHLAPDRHEFMKQLGATIGADYRSDPNTALQEFRVAIWKGAAHLLYHSDYSYKCSECEQMEYKSLKGDIIPMNRQYKICPYCKRTKYNNEIYKTAKTDDSIELLTLDNVLAHKLPKDDSVLESPIIPIAVRPKIADPEAILNDTTQRSKWFTVWVWNYFRQILNENHIETHNHHGIHISDLSDRLVIRIIMNKCEREGYKHYYDPSMLQRKGPYILGLNVLATAPEFSDFITELREKYSCHNIVIDMNRNEIKVHSTCEPVILEDHIFTQEQVVMLYTNTSSNNDDSSDRSWKDAVEFKSEDSKVSYDGELEKFFRDEAVCKIRGSLGDTKARAVFDILSQSGTSWDEFSDQFGDKPAKKSHIAKYLKVTPKQVDLFKRMIMTRCLSNDLRRSRISPVSTEFLARSLKQQEDYMLRDIRYADIISLVKLYRYMCRQLTRYNVLAGYKEIPYRLRRLIKPEIHAVLIKKLEPYAR
jgi:hypothetical protein